MALKVVRAEGVRTGELMPVITELVSRELFPLAVVDNGTPRLEALIVNKDIELLAVDKDTSVVGS